jgi:hypothetical protein
MEDVKLDGWITIGGRNRDDLPTGMAADSVRILCQLFQSGFCLRNPEAHIKRPV